jgi:hypothetical protein
MNLFKTLPLQNYQSKCDYHEKSISTYNGHCDDRFYGK